MRYTGKIIVAVATALLMLSACGRSVKAEPMQSDSLKQGDNVEMSLSLNLSKAAQGISVDIMNNGKALQHIDYKYDLDMEPNAWAERDSVELRDVTFDGHDDLLIYLGSYGNQGVEYFDCYVWDDSQQQFVHAPSFKEIQNPLVADSFVYANARESAAAYIHEKWIFSDGSFHAAARLEQQYSPDGSCSYNEYLLDEQQEHRNLTANQISSFWKSFIE